MLSTEISNEKVLYTVESLFELKSLPGSNEDSVRNIKKLAWRGDCLLNQYVNSYLWDKYHSRDVGFLNKCQDYLVSNESLARFLDTATNIRHVDASVNDHTKGTLFEWLLYLTSQLEDKNATTRVVKRYIEFITCTTMRHFFVEFQTKLDISAEQPQFHQIESWLEDYRAKPLNDVLKGLKADSTMTYTSNMISKTCTASHEEEAITFTWYSRARNSYTDSFFPCCGMRGDDKICTRESWPNPMKSHPGRLYQVCPGGKKAGGGICSSPGMIFTPRMQVPMWTCCRQAAPAPGCSLKRKDSHM